MAFTHTKLAEANQALASGSVEAAVLALVELWAKLPSSRITDLVQKLSSRLPHEELPTKVADRESSWLMFADTADPKIVPTLLSVEWPVHPRPVKARIERLEKFAPDPRIARALRELWLGGRYRSQQGGVFWRRAFRLLLNWKYAEASALIDAAKESDDGYFIVQPIIDRRTKTPLPTEPAVPTDIALALDEIEALAGIEAPSPLARISKESLFEAVYAEPTSDAPRLVLADLLLQEGDERGELIQLMHAVESGRGTGKMEARIKSLLRASGKKWLDGIGSVVDSPHFRCGFASEVTLRGKLDPSVAGWRTVETLHLGSNAAERMGSGVLAHPSLRALTHVDGVPMSELVRLAEAVSGSGEPRAFDRLGVIAPLTPLATSKIRVRQLAVAREDNTPIEVVDAVNWFEASAFRQTTKVLEVAALEVGFPAARSFLDRASSLDAIWLRPMFYAAYPVGWEIRLSRDRASGKPTVLEVSWHGRNTTGALGPTIRRLPDTFTSVVLRHTIGARSDLLSDVQTAVAATQPRASFAAFDEDGKPIPIPAPTR